MYTFIAYRLFINILNLSSVIYLIMFLCTFMQRIFISNTANFNIHQYTNDIPLFSVCSIQMQHNNKPE